MTAVPINNTNHRAKILQIGSYPPPQCGWAMQTKLLVEELRRQGHVCEVLNINENRKIRSREYVCVENGADYVYKLIRFACRGYRFQVHVNGQSSKGYLLALLAALVARIANRPIALSWRGGLQQKYFPCPGNGPMRWAYQILFRLSGQISCNNSAVKQAIERYGVNVGRVAAIPAFSSRHLEFKQVPLAPEIETFLATHAPVFFSYLSFRPEYKLETLRDAMRRFRQPYPHAGFIWLGFPSREFPRAKAFADTWPENEREGLLLLGNVSHDEFLTVMAKTCAYVRTPGCDGVSASVLEAMALGVPVVASDNGHRPPGVITYREADSADLSEKLLYVIERSADVKQQPALVVPDDTIARMVQWLLDPPAGKQYPEVREFAHGR